MKTLLLTLFLSAAILSANDINLLRHGAVFGGSSFSGVPQSIQVTGDYYFDKAADGKAETFWLPFDRKGPHELNWKFRAPIRADRFRWHGDRLQDGALLAEDESGTWRELGKITADRGELTFPEVKSHSFKLAFGEAAGVIRIFELELFGPEQPVVPEILPPLAADAPTVQLLNMQGNIQDGTVHLTWTPETKDLPENLYLLIRLGDRAPEKFRKWAGDIRIADFAVPLRSGAATFRLPAWAPPGNVAYFIECYGGEPLRQFQVQTAQPQLSNGPEPAISSIPVQHTELGDRNGQRGFVINGTFRLPFFMRYMRLVDYERIHLARANGIEMQYFMLYYSCVGVPEEYPLYFQRLDQQIRATLKLQPEALFLIGMDLRPDKRYLTSHPAELMHDRDGKVIIENGNPYGLISFGSTGFLAETKRFIDELLGFLKRQPYANRIIGYQPWLNSANDAFIGGIRGNSFVSERPKLKVGDYNPQAITRFRDFLRDKYQTEDALRQAWNNPGATFAGAMIPDNLVAEDAPGAVFRRAEGNQAVFDYWEFFPTLLGDTMREIAAYLKQQTGGNALVFMHYGAVLSTLTNTQPGGSRHQSNNNDFRRLLEDPNIDMFVQSFSYQYRHAGDPMSCYQLIDSINLHGKMYLSDYDARTFSVGWLNYGRHRSIVETEAVLARDFSFLLLKNAGAWLSDMAQSSERNFNRDSNHWFAAPEITAVTRRVLNTFDPAAQTVEKRSVAEVAVWVGLDSVKFEDTLNAAVIYRNLIRRTLDTELNRLGAPYDIYLADDLTRIGEKAGQYKLHIFLNAFSLKEKERAAIEQLKRNHTTLMWFYAPGWMDEYGRTGAERMRQLTGIQIETLTEERGPLSTTLEQSGKTFHAETYGGDGAKVHPAAISPLFAVNDPTATVIGRDHKKRPNLVRKQQGQWNSVYSASPFLPVEMLRSLAQDAGVHLYTDKPALMMADNRFLILHCGTDAPQTMTISLPAPQTIVDTQSGKIIAEHSKTFQIKLENPSTKILQRKD